ncbi:MAG: stage II sporulation protein M [Clostridia bacterium]|nr:stage II sporulation protein M [Clostridia bacterium]
MKNKYTGIISLSAFRRFFKTNGYNILLIAVTAAGLIYGTAIYFYNENSFISELINNMNISGSAFNYCYMIYFISNMLCLMILFIFGLCIAGSPFIILLIFIKSSGAGMIIGYLYGTYGFDGIEFCVTVFFPSVILLLTALIMAGNESLFTIRELKNAYSFPVENKKAGFSLYIKRYILPLVIVILSSFIQTACFYCLYNQFIPSA